LIVSGLSPTAYNQLAPLGGIVVIFFLALAATLITAGIGWFRRRFRGWRLAVIIISTQVLARMSHRGGGGAAKSSSIRRPRQLKIRKSSYGPSPAALLAVSP